MILRVSLYFDPQANRFTHQSFEVGEALQESRGPLASTDSGLASPQDLT